MSSNPNDHCECELKVGDLVHVPARVVKIMQSEHDNCGLVLETELDCHDNHDKTRFVVLSHQVKKCGGEELPSGVPEATGMPNVENIKVKHIDAESICLKSPDGSVRLDLVAGKESGGLWLKAADGSIFALFAAGHGRGFGYYSKESAVKGHAMDLAFTLDNDNQPLVQVKDGDGNVRHAMLNDIVDLLEKQNKQGGCCNA